MKQANVYYSLRAFMGLSFNMMFTAAGLYRIDIANLEIYQLILIGTALEIAIFFFEVPTGIVADLKSRKTSVIIGLFIVGIGILIEALTPLFLFIFISQVVWGLGYTFISGAMDSWISDEVNDQLLEHTIITGSQVYKIMSVIGIVLAAVIGMFNIRYALYTSSGIFIIMGIFSIYAMREENFTKPSSEIHFYKRYFHQLANGFSHIKKHKVLRIMFIIVIFFGLFSEGIDRTYELHILDYLNFRNLWNIPAIWILSIINASVAILGYLVLYIVKKYLKKGHYIYLWAFNFTLVMIGGILIFALLPQAYLALIGFLIFSVSREGNSPLFNSILLKNTPSKVKATVLSTFGQLDAIGQLLSGGLMVLISLYFNITELYIITAILLVVPLLLFIKLSNKHQKNQLHH